MTCPGCSPTMDLSNTFSFFEVGATTTKMVSPFRSTVVDCCTGSVLAADVTMVTLLRCAGVCEYVGAGVGACAGPGGWCMRRSWGVGFPATNYLGLCLSAAPTVTSGSEISGRGFAIIGEVHVGAAFAVTVLYTSLVRSAICLWSLALSYVIWSIIRCINSLWMLARTCIV